MKEFLKDNLLEIIAIIVTIGLMTLLGNELDNNNKERLAIINNKKENVVKYEKCEKIENYYYCYNEKINND